MKNTNVEKRKANLNPALKPRFSAGLIRVSIFFLFAVLSCGVLFWNRPLGFEQEEFMPGEPALRSYFSPASFTFIDEKKTNAFRSEQMRHVPPAYRVDLALTQKMFENVDQFFKVISDVQDEKRRSGAMQWKELPVTIPPKMLETLVDLPELDLVRAQVISVMGFYLSRGLLSQQDRRKLLDSGAVFILRLNDETRQETPEKIEKIFTVEEALEDAPSRLEGDLLKKKGIKNTVLQILQAVLLGNMVFDEARSRELQKKAADAVAPVEVTIKKNELIVQRGMLVTGEIQEKLDQVHRKVATQKKRVQVMTGSFLVFLLYFLAFFYFSMFERKFFISPSKLLIFHTVILLSLTLSKAVAVLPDISIYLMPTALTALLLTLLLHNRIGILGGIIMTVMSGFLSEFRTDIMLATLLASLAATFLAYRVRKRTDFVRIGLGIGCAYFVVIAGFQLAQNMPWRDAVQLGSFGFLNAIFATGISFLALPLLETCFDVGTDISLLELSDLNHPLIKRMMVEAPGTYHHSLVVSSLAEGACEQIGAHSLLAKVGCYFHDIGKIERPAFFAENQGYLYQNQHDDLPPKMSFEIIVNHVKQGIRLAHKYKIKRAIVDFIGEHQGTGVTYYFYKKAMDLAAPNEHVRADDFRYPGPKPQTKETAVVLLADSVEAASRALKELTPEAIQQLVRKIINDKFIDGQLDECELTLQDLHKIQASFVRNLAAIFHTRMKYPAVERPELAPDLFGVNQFYKFRADD